MHVLVLKTAFNFNHSCPLTRLHQLLETVLSNGGVLSTCIQSSYL